MKRTHFSLALLHPRYWLFWLGALLWVLLAQLPYRWQMWLARRLAPLLFLNKKRIGFAVKTSTNVSRSCPPNRKPDC